MNKHINSLFATPGATGIDGRDVGMTKWMQIAKKLMFFIKSH